MKSKYEKQINRLESKSQLLENEIKEKEQEIKLNALKLKDMIRARYEPIGNNLDAKKPTWNYSTSTAARRSK